MLAWRRTRAGHELARKPQRRRHQHQQHQQQRSQPHRHGRRRARLPLPRRRPPADVLSSAAACRRWRALACADSVWRARFRREKLLEKARLFEVALPPVPGGQGGAAAAASATAVVKDEAAGVGLAFYARIFALKVAQVVVVLRGVRAAVRSCPTSASHTHRRRRCAGIPDEGRGP